MAETGTLETEQDSERDTFERVRIALYVIVISLNVYVLWYHLKDTPEVLAIKDRIASMWERQVSGPKRRAKEIKKAEAHLVFEALGILEDTEHE